jgi:hypothetical protein
MATAAALVPAGVSLLTGILGKGASKKAQNAQNALYDKALGQQQGQFDQTQANFKPYLSAGGPAIASILDILGLNGPDPQQAAIAQLKGGPGFTSQYDTGVDTVLQNAAATGGLRGGNTQTGLAQFGSGLLNQIIQQQLAGLGGLAGMGAGAAGQIGQFGQANSSAITDILGNKGTTTASGILGRGAITNNTLNGLGSMFGPGGGLSGLFGGGGGNSAMSGAQGLVRGLGGW